MLDLKPYEKDSTLVWAVSNIQLPKAAKWDFSQRTWQPQILEDKSKYIVCQKPTQVGMSTVFLIKMLHFAENNTCRLMYTLPRQDDVYDMVNSRLDEIIKESPQIQKQLQDIDNVRMKKYGKSFLHFVEMSVAPRMLDVDWLLNDEVDLSSPENLQQVINRLDASKIGIHHRISTPTIDDYGINAVFKQSDMKQWTVTCPYCSFEQIMNWDSNVAHKGDVTWYVCSRCQNKLHAEDISEGRWVPTGNSKSDISGYQISQLMTPSINPNKLWAESTTIAKKLFYNNRLGIPYTPTNANFDSGFMRENNFRTLHTREPNREHRDATYVLGCDQGNVLHVSIGRLDNGTVKIVWLGTIDFNSGFEELGKLISRFKIRKAVIDALPNHHDARQLALGSNGKIDIAYFTQINALYREDEEKIFINKTDAYDEVLKAITDARLQFYGPAENQDSETKTAIIHLTNIHRDIEIQTTKHGGVSTFHVWKTTGPDHYADAILYMMMAADATQNRGELTVTDIDEMIKTMRGMSFAELYGFENTESGIPMFDGAQFPASDKQESMMRLVDNELAPLNPYRNKK